jgi:CBS domain containing-hemolysin-like protein
MSPASSKLPDPRGPQEPCGDGDAKSLTSRAATTGIFTPQELKLFRRTLRAGDLVVRELMVSRTDIIWIDEDEPPESVRLLDQFQSTQNHIASVVDEFGGTLGMLTLNDVTRAIVGDISRTGEPGSPTLARRSEREWLVDGRLPLHELVVGLELSPEVERELPDVSTVAGLVTTVLGHIPREGESMKWQGLTIEVIDTDGPRVDKLLVKRS